MLRRCVWVLFLLLWVGIAGAQPAPTLPDKTTRLVELAQVWAKVKVFHPYLGYKDLDWDAALVAAIPKVEAATTVPAYRAAVQDMLGKLGDPATRILDAPKPTPPGVMPPVIVWPDPEIAQISFAAFSNGFAAAMDSGPTLIADAAKAKVIVFDLRSQSGWQDFVGGQLDELWPAISEWPLQRVVQHQGFRTQEGTTSGDYSSSFVTLGGRAPLAGSKHPPAYVVFITDESSGVPAVAFALQASGRASIVAPAALTEDSFVSMTSVEVGGGMIASIRLGESLWAPPKADAIVPAKDLEARALALAKQKLHAKAGGHAPKPLLLPPYRARDDLDYATYDTPPRELRLLAGIRLWTTLEYFWPYRYLAGDWLAALRDTLPRLDAASTPDAYLDVLLEMGARARDGHINVWHANDKGRGVRLVAPFTTQLVEGKLAITKILDAVEAKKLGVAVGDVIGSINGKPTREALAALEVRVSGSTDEARDQNTARRVVTGTEPTVELGIARTDGKLRTITVTRGPAFNAPPNKHYKLLANNIGFADLTTLTRDEVEPMFKELASTKALIFDMRGYPHGTAWPIAPHINTKHASYGAQFDMPLVSRDEGEVRSSFHFFQGLPPLPAGEKLYTGKIIVLIDYRAVSQSEHTCLFFEAAAGATFIGSPTQGTNGDVTIMRLPGGLRMSFTGQEPRHADGRQLQRIGIEPTILVRPTLAGLRDGKDEILDRALAFVANGR